MNSEKAPAVQITPTNKDEMVFHESKPVSVEKYTGFRGVLARIGWHAAIVAIILAYVFALLYYTPWFTRKGGVKERISEWYGVNPKVKNSGHSEMVNFTYVMLTFGFITFAGGIFYTLATKYVGMPSAVGRAFATILRRRPFASCTSYGELIFLFFAIFGNLFVFYYFYTGHIDKKASSKKPITNSDILFTAALTLGFNSMYTMMFLCLPASRHCYWMDMLNIPYAHGVKYHRWLGVLSIFLVAAHGVLYGKAFYDLDILGEKLLPCFDCNLATDGMKPWTNVFGELSLIFMLILGIASIPWVRRKHYEVFYYTHHLFIPAIIFAVLHYANMIVFFYPSIMLYMINRIISSSHSNVPTEVVDFAALPNGVTRIVLKRSVLDAGRYRAGDFVYLRLPALSHLQWHAFSISSCPSSSPDTFTVYIKELGEWTAKLHAHAVECAGKNTLPVVYVDGFYGTRVNLYEPYSTVVLIGGGIGITPLLGMIEELYYNMSQGTDTVEREVIMIWSSRDLLLLREFEPLFAKLREYDPYGKIFKLKLYLTREFDDKMLTQFSSHTPLSATTTEYNKKTILSVAPRPFGRSVRSPFWQCMMFLVTFGASGMLLTVCRYGNRIQGEHAAWWPLQRLVELIVVILGACVGYVVAGAEFAHKKKIEDTTTVSKPLVSLAKPSTEAGNFVHEYNVESNRPNMIELMQTIQDEAINPSEPIGVFVSGPHSLITSVEGAGQKIQKSRFDIRHEEFEL